MYERIGSIRYTRSKPRAVFIEFFQNLTKTHSLSLVSKNHATLLGLSQAGLEEVAKELRVPELLPDSKDTGVAVIHANRLTSLRRNVPVTHFIYEDKVRGIRLNVDLAMRNEYRCIGIDIWLSKQLKLPGGFVIISAQREMDVSDIVKKMTDFCGWIVKR